jgi:hypothetical protein
MRPSLWTCHLAGTRSSKMEMGREQLARFELLYSVYNKILDGCFTLLPIPEYTHSYNGCNGLKPFQVSCKCLVDPSSCCEFDPFQS